MKPLGKVKIEWSPEFAYAIGLLVTDGCLSKDGRHMILVSKDREMIENFKACLNIENIIGIKGHLTKGGDTPMYQVKYAKAESLQLLPKIYYNRDVVCLSRKRKKIEKALSIENKQL